MRPTATKQPEAEIVALLFNGKHRKGFYGALEMAFFPDTLTCVTLTRSSDGNIPSALRVKQADPSRLTGTRVVEGLKYRFPLPAK